ncbi:MAG: gluconate:H+ symporter, GntP family [Verrucomicrobiota bacterium]
MTPPLAAIVAPDYWPFSVLIISVILIVVLITVLRVHAFLALILAAITAGLLAKRLPGEGKLGHWVTAVEMTATEFGATAGKIGVVIALASVIGLCLMESGAADKVVRRFLALFGRRFAGEAILISGYILSIPIFFDTFFMLLLPLAIAMRLRTGKDYLLYIMAICCGGTVTHSLIAPHPGPLAMAESLKLDLGSTIMAGIVVGLIPTACSWCVVKWINRRLQVPLREVPGMALDDLRKTFERPEAELPPFALAILPVILPILLISAASISIAIQGKGFEAADLKNGAALAQRLLAGTDPVSKFIGDHLSETNRMLLSTPQSDARLARRLDNAVVGILNDSIRAENVHDASYFDAIVLRATTAGLRTSNLQADNLVRFNRSVLEDAFAAELAPTKGLNSTLYNAAVFWGNRNVALLVGAALGILLLIRQRRGLTLASIAGMIEAPFATAGVIILITSAGGAFGLMLKNAGVGEAVKAFVGNQVSGTHLILISWTVAAVIRVAQGSATVAMLTTSAMIYPIMSGGAVLPYHPVYIFMTIGFGAMFLSWMNDSGFWVVAKLSGFTEKETLKSWTVVVTVNSISGLVACLILSKLLPFAPPAL